MKILIGCETSGTVRRAFDALGHDVWSCDILPADDGEIGRLVFSFPDYIITNKGRLISLQKNKPFFLKQATDAKGYRCVSLRQNGFGGSTRVHRLVAQAFIPNPDSFPIVRHIDGHPSNNHAENLAWGTYLENEADKHRHGTWELRRNGKLNESHRHDIRRMAITGISHREIADAFGVSRTTITRILNGRTWANDSKETGIAAAMADQWGDAA